MSKQSVTLSSATLYAMLLEFGGKGERSDLTLGSYQFYERKQYTSTKWLRSRGRFEISFPELLLIAHSEGK